MSYNHYVPVVHIIGRMSLARAQRCMKKIYRLTNGKPLALAIVVDLKYGSYVNMDKVYQALKHVRQRHGMPILGFTRSKVNPQSYYILSAADRIYTSPTTRFTLHHHHTVPTYILDPTPKLQQLGLKQWKFNSFLSEQDLRLNPKDFLPDSHSSIADMYRRLFDYSMANRRENWNIAYNWAIGRLEGRVGGWGEQEKQGEKIGELNQRKQKKQKASQQMDQSNQKDQMIKKMKKLKTHKIFLHPLFPSPHTTPTPTTATPPPPTSPSYQKSLQYTQQPPPETISLQKHHLGQIPLQFDQVTTTILGAEAVPLKLADGYGYYPEVIRKEYPYVDFKERRFKKLKGLLFFVFFMSPLLVIIFFGKAITKYTIIVKAWLKSRSRQLQRELQGLPELDDEQLQNQQKALQQQINSILADNK